MNWKTFFLIGLVAGGLTFASASRAEAGVSIGIGVGFPGYYGPYPYGYYPYGYYPRRYYPYGYRTVGYAGPRWYWHHGHRVYYSHPFRRR